MALLPPGMPLWVPMLAMGLVGIGTGSFMNIIVAVAQSAAPRTDTGSVTATISLVRQVGSTTATAIVGGLIGVGRHGGAARFAGRRRPSRRRRSRPRPRPCRPRSPSCTRACWRRSSSASRSTYVVGIVAALLLPHGRLSDELEPVAATEAAAETATA